MTIIAAVSLSFSVVATRSFANDTASFCFHIHTIVAVVVITVAVALLIFSRIIALGTSNCLQGVIS
jgi:hypothetical protein